MTNEKVAVVVAWHNAEQIEIWQQVWGVTFEPPTKFDLILQQDVKREGCAVTKNRGIAEAVKRGCDIVVVLDDDCFPNNDPFAATSLEELVHMHVQCLQPVKMEMITPVTNPVSRGTPYHSRTIEMPVAASMGFWTDVGDYDACGQLVWGAKTRMDFKQDPIFVRYFPLCGMNLAFRPKDWLPWCQFIEVPRFDDIWMGWLWEREAYRRGFCFNLNGPLVRHSRQSNVWQNLRDEARYLEENETLWSKIATHPMSDYETLRKLLPV